MFTCAWCQKEIESPALWSKRKEPLCAFCVGKYRYAVETGIATRGLSDLTKEERRNVSEALHELQVFNSAMHSVERQELSGLPQITAYIIFAVLIIGVITGIGWIINRLGENSLIGYAVAVAIIFIVILASMRIIWLLKFWQIKRRSGYKSNGW